MVEIKKSHAQAIVLEPVNTIGKSMSSLFAILSALSFGCADFTGGLASRRSPAMAVVLRSQGAGMLLALLLAPLFSPPTMGLSSWLWGGSAGLIGAVGIGLLYHGLAQGLAAIVSPTAALMGTLLPVIFGYAMGEKPGTMGTIGILFAILAVILLTWERGGKSKKTLSSFLMGAIAGLCFGGFFILLSQTEGSSGLWPLVAARSASLPFLFLAIRFLGKSPAIHPKDRIPAWGSGILDMAANVFYLLSFRSGMLLTAVVITSMYPAPTVLLQNRILKEPLSFSKIVGLLFAITGIALISVG